MFSSGCFTTNEISSYLCRTTPKEGNVLQLATSRNCKKPKAERREGGCVGDWHFKVFLKQAWLCLHTCRWQQKENSICVLKTGHLQEMSWKLWVDMSKHPWGGHLSLLSRGKLRLQGTRRLGLMDACSRRQVGQRFCLPWSHVLAQEKSNCTKYRPVGKREGIARWMVKSP